MEFQGISGNFAEAGAEALAITVFKGEKASLAELADLDRLTGGQIAAAFKNEEIKGDVGETVLFRFTATSAR